MEKLTFEQAIQLRMGYGCYKLGEYGWPEYQGENSEEILNRSFELGVKLFDTAPIYGYGRAEEHLGEVFSTRRHEIFIATKCGYYFPNGKAEKLLSSDAIMWSVEGSLKRLKTDYIDLLQIHYYDQKTPFDTVLKTLKKLQNEGVVRHLGISNCTVPMISKSISKGFLTVQEPYNLFQRGIEEEILSLVKKNDRWLLAYSPLVQGLFSEKYSHQSRLTPEDIRNFHPIFQDKSRWQSFRESVKKIESPVEMMLQFVLHHSCVVPLISTTSLKHLEENIHLITRYGRGRE